MKRNNDVNPTEVLIVLGSLFGCLMVGAMTACDVSGIQHAYSSPIEGLALLAGIAASMFALVCMGVIRSHATSCRAKHAAGFTVAFMLVGIGAAVTSWKHTRYMEAYDWSDKFSRLAAGDLSADAYCASGINYAVIIAPEDDKASTTEEIKQLGDLASNLKRGVNIDWSVSGLSPNAVSHKLAYRYNRITLGTFSSAESVNCKVNFLKSALGNNPGYSNLMLAVQYLQPLEVSSYVEGQMSQMGGAIFLIIGGILFVRAILLIGRGSRS